MIPVEIDFFFMFRWILALFCAIYTIVCSARTLFGWLDYFASSRQRQVLGRYAGLLLLRARIRRFGGELARIAGLLVILGIVVYMHRFVR